MMSHDSATEHDVTTARQAQSPAFSLPPVNHGVQWRELQAEDAPQISALTARIEARDNPPYRTSAEEIAEMLDPSGHWVGIAAVATIGVERGQVVAYTHMEFRQAAQAEVLCQGGVDPHFRRLGIGRAIVEWQTEAGRRILSDYNVPSGAIVTSVDPHHEELEEHLKAHGYRWSRSLSELRADLRRLPHLPAMEHYLSVEPWSAHGDELARQAVNQAAVRAGGEPISQEEWHKGRSAFSAAWSRIAYDSRGDRPRVAGFVLASRYEQDWAALGWREGYIDQLTVFEEWRHLGVAEALIAESMRVQKADGMERTGTGVSSDQHTDAHSIYDFLGFREVGQIRLYTLNVDLSVEASNLR